MQASRGSIWTPKDFLRLGNRPAIDQALRRLTADGKIRRVGRGLYDYPLRGTVVGVRAPAVAGVARAVARATGARVQMAGAAAANALGLSTQVPAHIDYLTDGPSRSIVVGRRAVRFRHVAPKRLNLPAGAASVVEALRYVGRPTVGRLGDTDIARIAAAISDADRRSLRSAVHLYPDWMRPTIDAIVQADGPDVKRD